MDPNPYKLTFTGSTNVRSAEFDPASSNVVVEFQNGSKYTYKNFTPGLLEEWRGAKSPGGWFNTSIKSHPDKYPQVGEGTRATPTPTNAPATVSEQASALAEKPAAVEAPPVTEKLVEIKATPGETVEVKPPAAAASPAPKVPAPLKPPAKPNVKSELAPRSKHDWHDRYWLRGPNGTTAKAR